MARKLQNFIGGAWVDPLDAERIDLVNPATEEVIAQLPAGSSEDVEAAIAAAAEAAPGWAARSLEERLEILERVADTIEAHVADLAQAETDEMGRPAHVGVAWISKVIGAFRESIVVAREYPFFEEDASGVIVERRPIGVVALITPWNFPTNVILGAIGPLLAAGNTVVLKPSEKSPLSAIRLVELLDLPSGVVNLVLGDVRAGAPLSAHPLVALTHFTGSVRSGKAIAAVSAEKLGRVVLELGGKDPVIVDAGVDVDAVARDVAYGSFVNTGQICTSMERIYVHRDVADRFVEALVAQTQNYGHGDPQLSQTAMGPLVDARQRQIVEAHVNDAIGKGATVRTGGATPEGTGYYYPATVLTDVTDDMVIMQEETFGPVAPIQIVDSFEEAIVKASSNAYGLAATVYTTDTHHARAAHEIPAGKIWINGWQTGGAKTVTYEPARQSGLAPTGYFASFDAGTRAFAVLHNPA